jgi:hypothetical protein
VNFNPNPNFNGAPQQQPQFAPPTTFVPQAQPQPVFVQQPQPVFVQRAPVVYVRPATSQADEIVSRGISDLNRMFSSGPTVGFVQQPAFVAAPVQVAAHCAHCKSQIVFQRVGCPVSVKCWACPHVNTFQ